MAHTLWYFELLGRFRAESHARSVERFRTQKTASFLAYLILHADQPQSRETLIDLFWQDSSPEAGQTNLRVALNSLRKQFEPPGIPANSLFIATRESIQVAADGIDTDVAQFEKAARRAQTAIDMPEQMSHWSEAIGLYKGRLLPVLYDDWIVREQQHLESLYLTALHRMIALCVQAGDVGTALEYALRAVDADPLNEESHAEVLRLYLAAAQPSAAVRHYQHLEKTLREQIDSVPSRETRALIEPWIGSKPTAKPSTPAVPPAGAPAPPLSQKPTVLAPVRPMLNPALPPRTGPLYGREEECRWLLETLQAENTSLLTLMGPGGVGKTRLATELAYRMAPDLDGKLAFVSLAEFTDPETIPFAILQAFQIRVSKQIEPIQALAEYLEGAPSLLVLDNFEQLMPSGIHEIRLLRTHIPRLKLLITSRHVLGIEGEQNFAVLPLPVPTGTIRTGAHRLAKKSRPDTNIEALLQNSSVQLFIERAQALRPDFQITTRNAHDLAEICTHLEGMPLAIELAASWINVLTPAQILERFQFPTRTLVSRRRDISPRHRTVQNTVAWSYQLLSRALQQSLCLLSTFRGGWTLEALNAVTNLPASEVEGGPPAKDADDDLVEILAELQERSLIFASEERIGEDSRMRYRMLESVREFCADIMHPDARQAARERHAAYFYEFSRLARLDYDTERQSHAISRMHADYDNVLTAMEWYLDGMAPDAPRLGMQIAVNLYGMWYLRGMTIEARHYLERVLAHPCNQERTAERASALNSIGRLYVDCGDNERALATMYEALDIRKEFGRAGVLGTSMNSIGSVLKMLGRWDEAFDYYRQAVALFREDGRTNHMAIALRNLGLVCDVQGDLVGADRYLRESLEICRRENYTHGLYLALGSLANIDYISGRLEQARERYEECLAFFREQHTVDAAEGVLSNLGRLYHDLGERELSIQALHEALTLARQMDDRQETILLFEHIAHTLGESSPLTAAQLSGAAQALRTALQAPKPERDLVTYTQFLDTLRSQASDAEFQVAFDVGLRMDIDLAIDFALASIPLA